VHTVPVLGFGCLVLDNLMHVTLEICTYSHNFKKKYLKISKLFNFFISRIKNIHLCLELPTIVHALNDQF
jgi:hypothetical protein